jgi:hypothetical protein
MSWPHGLNTATALQSCLLFVSSAKCAQSPVCVSISSIWRLKLSLFGWSLLTQAKLHFAFFHGAVDSNEPSFVLVIKHGMYCRDPIGERFP